MHLVLLTLFDLMPRIGLLEHVRIRPTNDVCAVKERRIKT